MANATDDETTAQAASPSASRLATWRTIEQTVELILRRQAWNWARETRVPEEPRDSPDDVILASARSIALGENRESFLDEHEIRRAAVDALHKRIVEAVNKTASELAKQLVGIAKKQGGDA